MVAMAEMAERTEPAIPTVEPISHWSSTQMDVKEKLCIRCSR